MKELTQNRLKEVIDYDSQSGVFIRKYVKEWRGCLNARYAGKVAGKIDKDGYRIISIDNKLYRAARLAWLYMTGEWPEEVDHIDLNTGNDKFLNLRTASSAQNKYNQKRCKTNTSGYKGVTYNKNAKKWVAQISIDNQNKYLGLHRTPELAYQAYCCEAIKLRGDFVRLA